MDISNRIQAVTGGGSGGWDLFLRARDMAEAGKPVVELTIGEHDIRTDPQILDAMHDAALGGHTGYAAIPGTDGLRKAIARRVSARTGVPTTPENVMVTPGGQAALFAAHVAVLDAGDKALYCDPYYATYPGTIRGAGGQDIPVPTRPEHAFQPQASDIEAILAANGGAKSILVNTPNNPTGVVYDRDALDGIAKVAKDHDLWVISDEVYDTQIWAGDHVSLRALPGMEERTLVVGSMSKSHAMTGSRIGWLIAPENVVDYLVTLATHTTYGVAGFVQDAALFALQQGEVLEVEIAAPFRRRRDIALKILQGQNALRLIPASGAMYVMLDIRATGLSGDDFAGRLLDEHLIAVMPGESFGNAAAGHIRVAMTVDDTTFETALKTLVEFAQTLTMENTDAT